MAPDGVTRSEYQAFGQELARAESGTPLLLQVVHRMREATLARGDGAPSYETVRWLAALAHWPAFADPAEGLVVDAESLARSLARLLREAGNGPIADLLLATLRTLPLGAGAEGGVGFPGLFRTALVLLLSPESPTGPEITRLLDRFEEAGAAMERGSAAGIGLCFLAMATELAIGLRCGLPEAALARRLHDLGTLAWRGAASLALALDAAEEREDRIRAALADPGFAMRAHARVPYRALDQGEDETMRKGFAQVDPLANQARMTLEEAQADVAALRADIAALQGMGRMLQEAAGAVLAEPQA